MNDEVVKELIKNLPMIIVALGTLFVGLIGAVGSIILGIVNYRRAGETLAASKANSVVLNEVHTATNGQSEKLAVLSEAVGFAKGEKSATAEGEKKAAELLVDKTNEDPLKVEIVKIPTGDKEKG